MDESGRRGVALVAVHTTIVRRDAMRLRSRESEVQASGIRHQHRVERHNALTCLQGGEFAGCTLRILLDDKLRTPKQQLRCT